MSGYRSLKRVLGETNLERKCRWLFGLCVGGLILLAFWWVDWIAEDLIEGAAQFRGRSAVSETLIDVHWQRWVTGDVNQQKLQQEMVEGLSRQPYQSALLKLDKDIASPVLSTPRWQAQVPANDFEREVLRRLKERAEREYTAYRTENAAAVVADPNAAPATPPLVF